MRTNLVVRARFLCGVFIVGALLLVGRLYLVQVVHGTDYRNDAKAQYVEPTPDTGDRGTIYFTTKDNELVAGAVMRSGWRIAITPKDIVSPENLYTTLSAITPIDQARFLTNASKKSDPYEEVAFRVSDDAAEKIRALKIPGVLLVQDQWRFYPAHTLASQAIGFVAYQGDTKTGVYGLERFYQDTLAIHSAGLFVNPFAELFSNVHALLSSDPAGSSGSIVTSIEPKVEQQLEDTLDKVQEEYTPDFSGGIVMDPHTGEIYALAMRPSFDPNTYNTVTDPKLYADALVEGRFELGSIMKPLTMASAIDSGAVTRESTYNDTGCITVSTYKVCNFDQKARGVIPMQEILSQSLNLGAAHLATKMGYPVFTAYMHALGLGDKTAIDLPNEVGGDLSTLGTGQSAAVNYDTAAFGQGISVSPIEMIKALSALANQGTLPNPHVVTGIKYESGITRDVPLIPGTQALKPATVDTVTNMLITVFDKGLLHGDLKQEHYTIAAKTGTAQIPMPGGGYYPAGTYLHSFFGYFPAHDPKFIVFLFAYKPHGQQYASATLAHPFMDIAKFLINYYDIPPDR